MTYWKIEARQRKSNEWTEWTESIDNPFDAEYELLSARRLYPDYVFKLTKVVQV